MSLLLQRKSEKFSDVPKLNFASECIYFLGSLDGCYSFVHDGVSALHYLRLCICFFFFFNIENQTEGISSLPAWQGDNCGLPDPPTHILGTGMEGMSENLVPGSPESKHCP